MLLSITSTLSPATDLGYLLFKNPARVHGFDLSFGKATVFYPEATAERCTVCLLLEVDPIGMVRRKSGPAGDGGIFGQYVNDRPYVASSFLSVAISEVFGTAMTGRSKDRPELAMTAMPLEAHIPVLPSRGGELLIRLLFGAYDQVAKRYALIHCGCIAHARRRFFEAIKALPKKEQKISTAAHEAVRRIDELYKIERETAKLSDDERLAERREKAVPLLESLHAWASALQQQTLASGKLGASLYSLVQTARANELEPYAYLRRLFAELPAAQTVEQIEALLPFQIRPSIDAKAA